MVASGDFKKIKAKVGKRAPARAHETDTSFKAATLHVAPQSSVVAATTAASSSLLTSDRGLSLQQLQQQLRHPAAQVRVSAVRGLQNMVALHSDLIAPHVSQLLAAVGPAATVDEDADVRQAGVRALQELVRQLLLKNSSSSSRSRSSSSHSQLPLLVPFAPYLTALLTTALNALDAAQRHDGAATVEWMATATVLDGATLAASVPQFLPPLTRLLSDQQSNISSSNASSCSNTALGAGVPVGSMRKNKTSGNKKRKRGGSLQPENNAVQQQPPSSKSSTSPPKQTALRAIHALLRATASETTTQPPTTAAASSSDPTPSTERLCSTAIFSRNQRPHQMTAPIFSLDDFPSWEQLGLAMAQEEEHEHATRSHDHHHHPRAGPAWMSTMSATSSTVLNPTDSFDLLTKLRDCFVEATQNKHLEQFLVCAATTRLLLESPHGVALVQSVVQSGMDNNAKRLLKLCSQMAASLLEWFPLETTTTTVNNNANIMARATTTTTVDEHNAALCQSLMRLAATVQSLSSNNSNNNNDVHRWMAVVGTHIQSCLEQDEEAAAAAKDGGPTATDFATSKPLVGVLEDILVGQRGSAGDSSNKDPALHRYGPLRSSLVELFCTVFFSPPEQQPSSSSSFMHAARSATGRAAAMLACRLLALCQYSMDCAREQYGVAVMDLLHGFPSYLIHWKADYEAETAVVVSVLQNVVRRIPSSDGATKLNTEDGNSNSVAVLAHLRNALEQLLTTPPPADEPKPSPEDSNNVTAVSIFENYPVKLQRQVVCFLTMLSTPTAATVSALGEICARCRLQHLVNDGSSSTVTPTVASFIVQCIHGVRKTMPMQVYIGFLVDSAGLLKLNGLPVPSAGRIGAIVKDMDPGVSTMVDCLVKCGSTKILPMLETLLSVLLKDDAIVRDAWAAIQTRAALSVLAMFSLDISQYGSTDTSVFEYLPEGFDSRVAGSISKLLVLCSTDERYSFSSTWVCPMIALLSNENALLLQVFGSLQSQLQGLDKSAQSKLLEIWLSIFRNPQLSPALRRNASGLISAAKKLESSYKDEPIQLISGRILAELEVST